MKRPLLAAILFTVLAPTGALAEFRQIDLTILGMD